MEGSPLFNLLRWVRGIGKKRCWAYIPLPAKNSDDDADARSDNNIHRQFVIVQANYNIR